MSNCKTIDTPLKVRVLAQYQLFSETEADTWFGWLSEDIVGRETNVDSAELLYTSPGFWGIQNLFFIADFFIPFCTNEKTMRKRVRKVLNKLVNDSDIIVLDITRLDA